MDVWISTNHENAQKMIAVVKEFGFNIPELSADLFLKKNQIIRMGIPPIRIEVVTNISGVNWKECFQNKIIGKLDGIEVNFIDLEHLKINKKAAGRYKDLNDLENLPD